MYFKNQQHDYTRAIKIKTLIPNHYLDKIGIKGRKKDTYARARSVFFDFMRLVIDDCIENNNKFFSPNKQYFVLYINEKSRKQHEVIFKKIDKVYKGVDLIKSNGKIYQFVFYSRNLQGKKYLPVRIGHHKYLEMVDKVNKGKRYFVK